MSVCSLCGRGGGAGRALSSIADEVRLKFVRLRFVLISCDSNGDKLGAGHQSLLKRLHSGFPVETLSELLKGPEAPDMSSSEHPASMSMNCAARSLHHINVPYLTRMAPKGTGHGCQDLLLADVKLS